jgi:hypothetical protein
MWGVAEARTPGISDADTIAPAASTVRILEVRRRSLINGWSLSERATLPTPVDRTTNVHEGYGLVGVGCHLHGQRMKMRP